MTDYVHSTADLVGFATRELADVENRARQARKRATGQLPLRPGMGSQAHWYREADRLDELTRTHARKLADLQARLNAETTNPDPF